jgi:hypothetical protein
VTAYTRSVAGDEPSLVSIDYETNRAYDDPDTYYDGQSPSILAALRIVPKSVAGSQPNETGTLTALKGFFRSLTGSQPNETGTLVRRIAVLRTLAGDQPRILTQDYDTTRDYDEPNLAYDFQLVGDLLVTKHLHVTLAGNQPATISLDYETDRAYDDPSIVYDGIIPGYLEAHHSFSRTLLGSQPAESGVLFGFVLPADPQEVVYIDGPYATQAQYTTGVRP